MQQASEQSSMAMHNLPGQTKRRSIESFKHRSCHHVPSATAPTAAAAASVVTPTTAPPTTIATSATALVMIVAGREITVATAMDECQDREYTQTREQIGEEGLSGTELRLEREERAEGTR